MTSRARQLFNSTAHASPTREGVYQSILDQLTAAAHRNQLSTTIGITPESTATVVKARLEEEEFIVTQREGALLISWDFTANGREPEPEPEGEPSIPE
jgi:hypothetical protein